MIREKSTGASLTLDGPFSIALRVGSVLQAKDLVVNGAARIEHFTPDPTAARYTERLPGIAVHYALNDPAGRFTADWAIILREGSQYIRQLLTIHAGVQPAEVSDISLIDLHHRSVELTGVVKGSPLVDGNFFLGFEHPLSQCGVVAGRATCELQRAVPIGTGQSVEYSSVVGFAQPGQMRRAFLTYLERERAHPIPDISALQQPSVSILASSPRYTQQDALGRIRAIGDELNKKRGVTLDSFLFDDGWDDHNDLWRIRADFKDCLASCSA